MNLTYLFINLGSVLLPFLFSFEKRIAYYKNWKYLFPAFFITAFLYLVWDHLFTIWGVWGFTIDYRTGLEFFKLPVEEILFFFTIPYASLFIYEALNYYSPKNTFFNGIQLQLSVFSFMVILLVGVIFHDRTYTAVNCAFAVAILFLQVAFIRGAYMGRFWRFYFVHLLPFFVVNGILTGTGISGEVVWYNNAENMGVRLLTIPV
ncbi:MAG: lycopene cyclase domain-containing protein, partial [Chitinophagales bacterium]